MASQELEVRYRANRSTKAMSVELEIYLITFDGTFFKYAKKNINPNDGIQNPDIAVKQLAIKNGYKKDIFCHSTSWRFIEGRVILTYIVFSAVVKLRAAKQINTANIKDSVLAHGLRHFKFLVDKNEVMVSPLVKSALKQFKPDLAGKISS